MKPARIFPVAALICLLLIPGQAVYAGAGTEWKTVSGNRLTVRFHGSIEAFANQVLERAETFLAETSDFLGLPWTDEYLIILAGSRDEFIDLQPTIKPAPEWAGALTYPGLRLVLIMTPGAMETGGSRYWSLLRHEMVHLILGDAETRHDTRLPRWFQEGVATYISGEMNLSRLLQLGWAQVSGATPEFINLEFNFPGDPARAGAAYARSYLFIKYISQRFGEDAVARLVAESFSGGGIAAGVNRAFDMSLGELLSGFDQYARVKATWIPVITSTATLWGMITLLFLATWGRKKIQGMRTLKRWDMEEEEEILAATLHGEVFQEDLADEDKPTLH